MSLTNVPSAEEAMGWNPQSLADYMRRLKLSSCDRVVLNCNISGAKFMHMKQRELEVFPRHCVPILANIQREMNKGAQRTTFDVKSMTEVHPVQVFSQNEEVWESDEFDSESDICEGTDYKEDGEDYICALTEEQIAENKHSGQAREGSCVPQAFAHTMKPPKPHKAPKPQDSCRERSANPPQPPSKRTDHISPRPFKAPTHYSDLKRNRMKLPQLPDSFQRPGPKLEGGVAMAPGSSSIRLPPPRAHQPTDAFNR
ncbi:uncharacterized protein [Leuresthes tenuis]|uniref:uncharacterized protein n=1 Tax=Leuresthes tenuis TaxID=355514 RepID=UPI003B509B0D